MDELIASLILSLIFTEALECGFAWGQKKRGKALLLCALVNLITNPPVVLLSQLLGGGWLLIAGLELAVVATEGLLYRYSGLYTHPFRFSLFANVPGTYRYRLTLCGQNSRTLRALTADYLRQFSKDRRNKGVFAFADVNSYD